MRRSSAFGKSLCADAAHIGRYGGSRTLSAIMTGYSQRVARSSSHRHLQQPTIHKTTTLHTRQRPHSPTCWKLALNDHPQPWLQQSRCPPHPAQRHPLIANRKASIFSSPHSQDLDSQEHSLFQSHQIRAYATFFTRSTPASLRMSTQPWSSAQPRARRSVHRTNLLSAHSFQNLQQPSFRFASARNYVVVRVVSALSFVLLAAA